MLVLLDEIVVPGAFLMAIGCLGNFVEGGVIPKPLFDTQVAAMVAGFGEQVGYETLVRKIAKANLDKSSRFTDWSRRPLSDAQKVYALADDRCAAAEYREDNNSFGPLAVNVGLPPSPDLSITLVNYTPLQPQAGQPVTYTVQIRNSGAARCSGRSSCTST